MLSLDQSVITCCCCGRRCRRSGVNLYSWPVAVALFVAWSESGLDELTWLCEIIAFNNNSLLVWYQFGIFFETIKAAFEFDVSIEFISKRVVQLHNWFFHSSLSLISRVLWVWSLLIHWVNHVILAFHDDLCPGGRRAHIQRTLIKLASICDYIAKWPVGNTYVHTYVWTKGRTGVI